LSGTVASVVATFVITFGGAISLPFVPLFVPPVVWQVSLMWSL
jgi:hypothetical protein